MSIRTNFSPIPIRNATTRKKHIHTVNSGTYGCVYRPALRCRNKTRSKPRHVSKLMNVQDAKEEIQHYENITHLDPHYHFHLKISDTCIPNKADFNAMLRCDSERVQRFTHTRDSDLDQLKLLVIKDGGVDLDDAEPVLRSMDLNHLHRFFKECTRLLEGIVTVHAANYCMSDIKPNNIVYDAAQNRVNYIDFGTLCRLTDYIGVLDHYNDFTFFHNYPLESYFLLRSGAHYGEQMLEGTAVNMSRIASKSERTNRMSSTSSKKASVEFHQVVEHIARQNKRLKATRIIKDYEAMVQKMKTFAYIDFVSWCIHRVDVYQLGITFMGILDVLNTGPLYNKLYKLFYDMMHPNVFKRILPEQALTRYRDIMNEI